MLRRQLCKEMRKGVVQDCVVLRMWKKVKAIFTLVAPNQPLPRCKPDDFRDFHMLIESCKGVTPPKQLDSNVDTTSSQNPK